MATRELTSDERRAWVALTGLLIKLPTALDADMARTSGLTFFEYTVLATLAEERTGTLRMSALAERTQGTLSRLSHVVRRLERQGMVQRVTAPEDRRATNAILTAEGRRRVESARPAHTAYVRETVIDGISRDDLLTLTRVHEGILARLDAAVPGPA